MIKLDKNKNKKIHGRRIEIATYEYEKDAVVVEGRLLDTRFKHTYYLNGDFRPPGTVHELVIRMKVKGVDLRIEDIDVDMDTIPHQDCRELTNSLQPILGMKISSGFTGKVKEKVGGAKGCTHLVALLLAMAPAAVQGAWSAIAQHPIDPSKYSGAALKFLENTCWVWRSEGELMKEYREKLTPKKMNIQRPTSNDE